MGSHKYLMGSDIIWVRSNNGHPLVSSLIINKDFEQNKKNSKNYLEYLFLHHITHILGFNLGNLNKNFNIFTNMDVDGIKRTFINSTKVVQVAKKYFNC